MTPSLPACPCLGQFLREQRFTRRLWLTHLARSGPVAVLLAVGALCLSHTIEATILYLIAAFYYNLVGNLHDLRGQRLRRVERVASLYRSGSLERSLRPSVLQSLESAAVKWGKAHAELKSISVFDDGLEGSIAPTIDQWMLDAVSGAAIALSPTPADEEEIVSLACRLIRESVFQLSNWSTFALNGSDPQCDALRARLAQAIESRRCALLELGAWE